MSVYTYIKLAYFNIQPDMRSIKASSKHGGNLLADNELSYDRNILCKHRKDTRHKTTFLDLAF